MVQGIRIDGRASTKKARLVSFLRLPGHARERNYRALYGGFLASSLMNNLKAITMLVPLVGFTSNTKEFIT